MEHREKPQVLFVFYTYSQQARIITEAMAETFRERGCEVRQARIELTDPRYAERFSRFPLRHPYRDLFRMLAPQLRRATGEIRVPEDFHAGDPDLIVIGSPTWWLTMCMPIRSFLKSDDAGRVLAHKRFGAFVVCRRYWRNNLKTAERLGVAWGGAYAGGTHFAFAGGQVRSLLSLLSYLGKGEDCDRYLGVRIPPTNLQADYPAQARAFANGLADQLFAPEAPGGSPTPAS